MLATIARSSISLKDCEDLDKGIPAVACMKLRADKTWGMFVVLQNYDLRKYNSSAVQTWALSPWLCGRRKPTPKNHPLSSAPEDPFTLCEDELLWLV